MNISYLQCTICGEKYAADKVRYVCPKHGDEGILDVVYDYDKIRRKSSPAGIAASPDRSIWRYWDLLPIEDPLCIPPLLVGWTPLYRAESLGNKLGLRHVYL